MKKLLQAGIIITGAAILSFTVANARNDGLNNNPHGGKCSNDKHHGRKHVRGETNATRAKLRKEHPKGK